MTYQMLPIQQMVWQDKYKFTAPAGVPRLTSDNSIEDTWRRIAHALAEPEGHEQRMWEKRFYSALENFQYIPAGRIIAGAGTYRDVTLFNCFVQGIIPDSMDGIFARLREAALTMQQGGGIGVDFSPLRPNGADVKGVAAKASGPVSFMDCWDAMCKTIMSAGARRGAMMGTLRCDHPDIELFIDAKRDPLRLRNFNLSVLVTDIFMDAIKRDESLPLEFGGKVYRRVGARYLWDKIMRSAYDSAEPGVIFIDRINKTNNLAYCETIYSTNPCSEQPLPPNGACLLGSINLTAFIRHPFEDRVYWDEHKIIDTTKIAVRMMDNVIDVSNYPLPEQRQEAMHKRRIGLGITGLADALTMCGLHYGSPEACKTAELWMKTITTAAYEADINLAAEKGKFPAYSPKMGRSYYPERGDRPMRNGTLISIAPTGTISLFAGNISSGIEPIFEWEFTRNILTPDGGHQSVQVEDWAVRLYREKFPGKELPPQFYARAHELSPKQHLAMQKAVQPWVCSSISKTVNCPADMPFEDFEQLYMDAYDGGLKCCAAFREGSIANAVLQVKPKPESEEGLSVAVDPVPREEILSLIREASGVPHKPTPRELTMSGRTHKLKWNGHGVYVTINDDKDGEPYEIFINSLHSEFYAWSVALTRMISAIWRRGGDTSFVVKELKAIADPRGGAWSNGTYIPSIQAAIGYTIEEHIAATAAAKQMSSHEFRAIVDEAKQELAESVASPPLPPGLAEAAAARLFNFCPRCGSTNVWFPKRNCLTCKNCDYSNCE